MPITTPMPAVKPVVTGCGTNWISRPMCIRPIPSSSTPASIDASIRPPGPKRADTGASSTTNAAVGPETFQREPPKSGISAPATIEV